jgi:hypothetical protein
MLAKSVFMLAASLAIACSGSVAQGTPPAQGDTRLFVPETVSASQRIGNNSAFDVTALSLLDGSDGLDLYAAVKNAGDAIACNTSFSVELRDQDDQVVAAGVNGLMARRFYRFSDDAGPLAGTVAGCLAPGDLTQVAVRGLTVDPPNAYLRSAVYYTNSWSNLDLVAIPGVSLVGVSAVQRAGGVAYQGSLINGLDTTLSNPTVAVYPVNAVGRPLGVAYGASSIELAPGGTWNFETNTVTDPGVGFDAYPMGGP